MSYENLIKLSYTANSLLSSNKDILLGAVVVSIEAYYAIPKSKSKKWIEQALSGTIRPLTKPDGDNIAKVVCDALNGIAYKDDSQIVRLVVNKWYSDKPRV